MPVPAGPAASDLYVTVDELKVYLGGISDSRDDLSILAAVTTCSRAIDQHCNRRFADSGAATARLFQPTRPGRLDVDDFHTTVGLVVASDDGDDGTYETTWSASDWQLEPLNGIVDGETGWPYSRIRAVESRVFPCCANRASVQVTARWGWAEVPAPVKQACYILAADIFKLAGAPFGVAGYGDFGPVRVRDNPRAAALLAPYRKTPVLVG